MISRRDYTISILAGATSFPPISAGESRTEIEAPLFELKFPSFKLLRKPTGQTTYGHRIPDKAKKEKVNAILAATPAGPRPIDIAQSFVDRFYKSEPLTISQRPSDDAWNPLIVEFFSATGDPANSDMIPWCAAFANWCLRRAKRNFTSDAGSQSFLQDKRFKTVTEPEIGDLVVFTCYGKASKKSVGLGHVAFVKEKPDGTSITVVGGNQSRDGHSSIISHVVYPLGDREITRTIAGRKVPVVMRKSAYISVS